MFRALCVFAVAMTGACAPDVSVHDIDGDTVIGEETPWVAAGTSYDGPVEVELIPAGSVPMSSPCVTVDFDTTPLGTGIDAGLDVETTYGGYGLTIATFDNTGKTASTGITFDSSDPTGGDVDLGTPNEAYGGPGESSDGSGASNDTDQYNVLIRAEDTVDGDGDRLVDDPDDHADGALFEFTWLRPQNMDTVVLLDVESAEVPAKIRAYDVGGTLVGSVDAGGEGDNSREEVEMDWPKVTELTIELQGSGAVDDLTFCPSSSIPE